MALIKQAIAAQSSRQAVVLDLGDLQRQGDQIIDAARRRAETLIREGQAERDRLISGAAERGHQEGLARGLTEGEAKGREQGLVKAMEDSRPHLDALQKSWLDALSAFQPDRERMLHEAQTDVLRLAAAIADRVTKRAIVLDPAIVVEQLRAVLSLVVRPTGLAVAIHPDDRAILAAALPDLLNSFPAATHAELLDDPALQRGSCVARTRATGEVDGMALAVSGQIDASIATQLDRIIEVLLPGSAPTSESPATRTGSAPPAPPAPPSAPGAGAS